MSDDPDDHGGEAETTSEPAPSDAQAKKEGYRVGYGKPPKHTQFKRGQTGNKQGGRARPKQMSTLITRELDAVVTVKEGGKPLRLPKREAIVKRLIGNALNGDVKAIAYLLQHDREYGAPDPFQIGEADLQAGHEVAERLLAEKQAAADAAAAYGGGTGEAQGGPMGEPP